MSSQPTGVNPKLVDVDSTLFKAAGTLLQLQAVLGAFYGLAEAREGKLREDDQAWTIIEVCQMLANSFAVDPFGNDVICIVRLTDLVNGQDIGMIKSRCSFGLPNKAIQLVFVLAKFFIQELDRH